MIYAFWNNKGGTGKTSLAFQVTCHYANNNLDKKVLVIDVCPQANLSELFLGGLHNKGSDVLLQRQGHYPRCTIGGYFQSRLPSPYIAPNFNGHDFISHPHDYNELIPKNIDIVCGDPLLELQSNAISTLANNQVPGTDPWISVIDWISDFIKEIREYYDIIFIDTNPSFSMYTQIAISSADRLILPVMADDSSRRAIQNAFSLIYGLKLPSEIYAQYAFCKKIESAGRDLPRVHLILKNRLTQYMGPASAYAAVLDSIAKDISDIIEKHPRMFTFQKTEEALIDIRDFQTTGVVAYARGCPFYNLKSGNLSILGQRVQVKEEYRINCVRDIDKIVSML
jgi:cellulose biosynthesis protein BcsQ